MSKTKTELATRALQVLGVVAAGQSVSAEDLALVVGIVDPLAAQLGLEGAIYVGDTDEIEDAVFLPLSKRLAMEVAPDFGLPGVDPATLIEAEKPLRRLSASAPSYAPQQAKYF